MTASTSQPTSPFVAVERWLYRFTDFVATKHGLAQSLHSGDPAFDQLPAYFRARFGPALAEPLDTASTAGEISTDRSVDELLYAVARLCQPVGDAVRSRADVWSACSSTGSETGRDELTDTRRVKTPLRTAPKRRGPA